MGVKDNPTPPTASKVDAQYNPVVVALFRLPTMQVAAMEQIELYPGEPQLESSVH